MRLRSKFALITACASVGPILVGTLVVRDIVERRSREGFNKLLTAGEREVRAEVSALREEAKRAAKQLADPDDPLTGRILLALARGELDDETTRKLSAQGPRVMRQRGLDVLTIVDRKNRVLACGHFTGRIGDTAPRRPSKKGRAQLVAERVRSGRGVVTRLTVQSWAEARSELGSRVFVMAGRALDQRFVRRLRRRGDMVVRIVDARGRQLAGPDRWQHYARYPKRQVRLAGATKRDSARITLAVPDDQLQTTLDAINYGAAALVAGGVMLSLLLGATAGRAARPLEELAARAESIAAGDLEQRIPVRSRDEVGDLVASFNNMAQQLSDSQDRLAAAERVAAWREIAQRIAHEIKNPLFPIQTSIETLQKVYAKKHPDFEEIFDESTGTILEEVGRLKRIVSEFSSFARMPKPKLAPCGVGELVGQVASRYAGDATVKLEVDDGLPSIDADREQLTQVLVNLINNAKDAIAEREGGEIVLAARAVTPDGGGRAHVVIDVRDNGGGFDRETAAKLFTPYFTTKGRSGGSGLGLAIVHRIVTDHGGTIEARSVPGQGATFSVRLPLGAATSAS
ncbi:MAG: HAMP domain-containing protein [Myxococcales bacterium]|nr:HAMP domain-containing protein [Myxococcales bacterium]